MFFEEIITLLPMYYYLSVFAVTLIFTGIIIFDIISFNLKSLTSIADIKQLKKDVLLHQGCHIENLPLISDIFEDAPYKQSNAFNNMMEMSQDLYQKKWIPDPSEFFDISSSLDSKTKSKLTSISHLYYLITGFVIFVIINISSTLLFNNPDARAKVLILSLLPLLISLFLTIIFSIEKSKMKTLLNENLDTLASAISLKLPVFSENNGMSMLINQFLEYDRNMSSSVDNLSEKIDRFVMEDLKSAVSESIERTLLDSVSPSIERANDAIIALSKDISRREQEGMKELALNFSNALTTEFSYQFAPLVDKISEVSNTLSNSKNYLDIVSTTLEEYKDNLLKLQNVTSESLKDYEETKREFSKDIHNMSDSISKFQTTNQDYQSNVFEGIKLMEESTTALNESTRESNNTLKTLLDGIFVEARNAEKLANDSQEISNKNIDMLKEQINTLMTEMDSKNSYLINGLDKLMKDFFNNNSENIKNQQDALGNRFEGILNSMEESSKAIKNSTNQLRDGFNELEAARIRAEEEKNRKKGFFRKSK